MCQIWRFSHFLTYMAAKVVIFAPWHLAPLMKCRPPTTDHHRQAVKRLFIIHVSSWLIRLSDYMATGLHGYMVSQWQGFRQTMTHDPPTPSSHGLQQFCYNSADGIMRRNHRTPLHTKFLRLGHTTSAKYHSPPQKWERKQTTESRSFN